MNLAHSACKYDLVEPSLEKAIICINHSNELQHKINSHLFPCKNKTFCISLIPYMICSLKQADTFSYPNHEFLGMLVLSDLFFLMWSKIGVRNKHTCILYKGKYTKQY